MRLHEFSRAPNARRVNIFLAEIDVDIERVQVDIRAGDNLTEQYKSKVPNGLIPFLELDDGTCIFESVAICRYLEAVNDNADNSLFGNSALTIAKIEMWNRMAEHQVLLPALQAFRNITGIYTDRENTNPQWGEESKQRYLNILPTLDQQLSQHEFIAGNTFSIADITLFCTINFMRVLKLSVGDDLPHLKRWLERIKQRPSVLATEPS